MLERAARGARLIQQKGKREMEKERRVAVFLAAMPNIREP